MNENVLKIFLQGTLIVPFSNQVITQLCKVCEKYISSSAFKEDQIYECVMAYLTGCDNSKVMTQIKLKYINAYNALPLISPLVEKRLAGFLVYLTISRAKDRGRAKGISASVILMNCLIVSKGHFGNIPCPEIIAGLFWKLDDFLKERGIKTEFQPSGFVFEILKNPALINERKLEGKEIDEIRYYINNAYKQDMMKELETDWIRSITNSYIRVYVALKHIIDNMRWNYHNFDLMAIIDKTVPNTRKTESQLNSIIRSICRSDYFIPQYPRNKSSILLRMMCDDGGLDKMPFAKESFTVEEFAVYLYYELIFEKLNRNI